MSVSLLSIVPASSAVSAGPSCRALSFSIVFPPVSHVLLPLTIISCRGAFSVVSWLGSSQKTEKREEAYLTLIVTDGSLVNPTKEPVPEGTIEAYARKMAESIRLTD